MMPTNNIKTLKEMIIIIVQVTC